MSAFNYNQHINTNSIQSELSNQTNDIGINYIMISPIESYLPKDYVKMILDDMYCNIDLEGSAFIPNKKNENININDESNIFYVGIMKINRWRDNEMANQLIDHLICDMPYKMNDYGWTIEKYNPSDSDDEELENVDMEFLESNSLQNSDNMSEFDGQIDDQINDQIDNYSNYDVEDFDD